jgi:hypothetical protein
MDQERKGMKKVPKSTIRRQIKETRKLIQGKDCVLSMPEYGLRVFYKLGWESDREPTITNIGVGLSKTAPQQVKNIVKNIWKMFSLDFADPDYEVVQKLVLQSKDFKEFSGRIKAICQEADKLEKDYEFCWENEVLNKAEI